MKHEKKQKKSKLDSSWFIVIVSLVCLWLMDVGNDTLYNFNPWFLSFAAVGVIVGIVRLILDKTIVWNWKECLGGFFYVVVHLGVAMLVAALLIGGVGLINSYVPTDHPQYTVSATFKSKYGSRYRTWNYKVVCDFDDEKLGKHPISVSRDFYKQAAPGDRYFFTLKNGGLSLPVVISMTKQE